MKDATHIYNLKAVIKEVGLSPATLRAWERRYGLLKPQRSSGGHRLYSRQDIEMLKWLIARQGEGLSISSAVELWKNQKGSRLEISQQAIAPVLVSGTSETIVDDLRESWLSGCLVFDDLAANQALDQAFAIAAPETVCIEVLQKGLSLIGERWYGGSLSVQQEHFASAIAMRRINTLLAAATPPIRSGHILLGCPPGEEHDFILLLIAFLLKRSGWDVVYLGANVPLKDLDATIQSTSPSLILSAAQMLNSAASLRAMSETVASHGVPLAYGGGIFRLIPTVTQSISGYYLGTDVANVPQMVDRLVMAHPLMPIAKPVSLEYSQMLEKFIQNEADIVTFVANTMHAGPVEPAYLAVANAELTRLIASALALGDINFIDNSVEWLNGLLKNNGLSTSMTRQYYVTYQQAIERYLGQEGAIIKDCLNKYEKYEI